MGPTLLKTTIKKKLDRTDNAVHGSNSKSIGHGLMVVSVRHNKAKVSSKHCVLSKDKLGGFKGINRLQGHPNLILMVTRQAKQRSYLMSHTTGVAGTLSYVAPEYAMTCRVLELILDERALDLSFSSHIVMLSLQGDLVEVLHLALKIHRR